MQIFHMESTQKISRSAMCEYGLSVVKGITVSKSLGYEPHYLFIVAIYNGFYQNVCRIEMMLPFYLCLALTSNAAILTL